MRKNDNLKAPQAWADELGMRYTPAKKGLASYYLGPHNIASAQCGWEYHEYHAAGPMMLTKDLYQAAIDAAIAGDSMPSGAVSPLFAAAMGDN